MKAGLKKATAKLILMFICANAVSAAEIGSYYPAWSKANGFTLKQLEQSGVTDQFTYLNYAFENIYKMPDGTYRCNSGADVEDHDEGLGMRATLDYAGRFDALTAVNGSADQEGQLLAGNFNQIRQIRVLHPQLKVLVSLGGWSWSRWFSAAAATPTLRQTLVASCIDLYITGNLPLWKGYGGAGAAAGLFDGFDIDWEHPGLKGMSYNTVSKNDRRNYTLLLAEFRKQLDEASRQNGKQYYLTAAINGSRKNVVYTDPASYVRYLNWINLMTYDFHGAWDNNGPASFQSNLFSDPVDPDPEKPSVDADIKRLLKAGVPSRKIVMGIPLYGRGWRGVNPDNNGLYQHAAGPAVPESGSEPGADSYAHLSKKTLSKFYHPLTRQLWTYDNGTFWTFDDAQVVHEKVLYARKLKLGGMMSWSLDQDDAAFSLSKAMFELR